MYVLEIQPHAKPQFHKISAEGKEKSKSNATTSHHPQQSLPTDFFPTQKSFLCSINVLAATRSHNVKEALQVLGDQSPLVLVHLVTVELLQCVDTETADLTV
jgi:hypothetical protein